MVYTEQEARTKWCPMGRHDTTAGNRIVGSPERAAQDFPCVASECMMWRWQPLLADDAFKEAVKKAAEKLGDKSPSRKKAVQHVIDNRSDYGLPDKPYRGFCGLAGEPPR